MAKKFKNSTVKLIAMITIVCMILGLSNFFNSVKADSYRYEYNGSNLNTGAYPGFKEKIDALKAAHPNWTFKIMETGLDWNNTIIAESSQNGNSPYSLIQSKSGAWLCSDCGTRGYDNGSWYHASSAAIKYYMDARNWLNDNGYLFQFLQLGYSETSDESVYNALSGTFLYSMDNARIINNTCRSTGSNPYFIIARIIQEQSAGGSATWRMQDGDGTFYNIFNIGAGGSGSNASVIANAKNYAKNAGWTSLEASLRGGINELFSGYINYKQDTLYLQKFDVETYGGVYTHQYMQNIEAPKSEGMSMYNKISNTSLINGNLTFIIPVFTGMPSTPCQSPSVIGDVKPINIRVKEGHTDINLRSGRSTSSSIVCTVADSNVNLLSVERIDGWHKVVLENGQKGYIYFNTSYLEQVNDVVNCSEQMTVTGSDVNLRAGPGLDEAVATTLYYGQIVTRIDNSGRYNIGGITWDRVRLSDGTQGFVSRDYLESVAENGEILTVSADGGLYLRTAPGRTTGVNIRIMGDGLKVTRIEVGTQEIDGYYWDKVVTPDGATGYCARAYLRDSNGNVPSGKVENNTTVTAYSKGDPNGDGSINSGDLLVLKKHLIGTSKATDEKVIKAMDINSDGEVNSGDLLLVRKHLIGTYKISN